jgi:hypothetical protein
MTPLQKYYRAIAKWRLVRRYQYLNEVNKILEEYIKNRILSGSNDSFIEQSRKELVTKQAEIKENEALVAFIKKLK